MGLYAGASVGRTIKKKFFVAALMASTCISNVALTLPKAYAQSSRQTTFNIPAGSLSSALTQFGRQSGLQVTYLPAITSGKQSSGASGTLAPSDALGRILAGSGLSYRISGDTVTVGNSDAGSITGDGSTVLNPIIITSKTGRVPADTPYETPGSSAYISNEQIEQRRGTSVGDFLSGIPGVINGDSRNSGAVDVNIRGMQGQGRVPVIVDGASQETSVYMGYNGSGSRSYIDPDFIGSVSIEKGPSAGADATGATGGVVRMTTIGVDDILLPGKSFGVRLKGGFNTNSSSIPASGTLGGYSGGQGYYSTLPSADTLFQPGGMGRPGFLEPTGGSGSIALAGTTEYLDVVAAYARRKNGNYHAGSNGGDGARAVIESDLFGGGYVENGGLTVYRAGEEVLNTSLDNESWLLKTKIKLDDGHSMELGYSKYKSDYGQILGSQMYAFGAQPYQGWLSSIELDTYTAQYIWNPEDNDLFDFRVNAFLSKVDNRVNSSFRSGDTLYPQYFWVGSDRWGLTASNTSRFTTDIGDFSFQYGGSFTRESVGLPDGVEYDRAIMSAPREGARKEASGFTSLEWKPADWLALNGSLRYSRFESVDNYMSRIQPFERSSGGWSPIASITVEPLEGVQIYGKYGSVLRSPSIFESLTSASFLYPVDENPVDPERVRSVEIGFNYLQTDVLSYGDKLRFHAAYFDNHIDNYITRSNIARVNSAGRTIYSLGRLNLDYAEMRGFEVSAEYDTGKYFGGIAWNHYTDVMFCAPEGVLQPGMATCSANGIYNSFSVQHVPPKDTLTVNLGARFLDEKLTVGSRIQYVGSRFSDGADGSVQTAGVSYIHASKWNPYTLVDVYASYKFNEHASFDFSIDNLTDRYYVDALNAIPVPAPGRTVRVSFTTKF